MSPNRLSVFVALFALLLLSMGAVSAQEDAEEAAEAQASSTADLVLAGWSSSVQEDETLQTLLDQFTAETGITVEFIPSPDHNVTMQTAFASGQYANVFYVDSSRLPDWVEAGVVDVGEGKIEDPDGFYPDLLDIFRYEDILYCPPKDYATMALQYNRDLFDAAGIDYPTADWTWDDLYAAAEAVTAANEGVLGLVTPANFERWLPFLYQAGGRIFDDEGNYVMNDEAARAALDFYTSFASNGIGGPPSAVDAGWGGEALGLGKVAMALEGSWVINYLLQNHPEINWGVVELPTGPAGRATMAFSVCYGVAADNDNMEESWQLVNFLTGEQGQIRTAEVSFGSMPTRPEANQAYKNVWVSRAEGLGFDPADVDAFIAGAEYAYPWQLPVGFGPFVDVFNAALQQGFAGSMTAEDILFEAELAAQEVAR